MTKMLMAVVFGLLSTSCTTNPTPYENKLVIIPEKVVTPCTALPALASGDKSSVLEWAIASHGIHGECTGRKDISDDFIRILAETGARAELWSPTKQ